MNTPIQDGPDAGDFANYRSLLADRLRRLKAEDAKFSHRFINQRMGARSAGWFADVIAGRQKLKPRHVSPLAAILRLDARDKELLRIFVELEMADSAEAKSSAHGKWLELKGVTQENLDRDRFRYFDHWYYPVLRELLLLLPPDAKKNPAALAARLSPPVTPRQAKQAVETLDRLGLLNADAPAPVLVKRPGKTPHWQNMIRAYTELALPAMTAFGRDERDVSALTLSLSPEGLAAAGEEIAALRRHLLMIAERDAGKNRVFQCVFHVFPLSQPVENPDA